MITYALMYKEAGFFDHNTIVRVINMNTSTVEVETLEGEYLGVIHIDKAAPVEGVSTVAQDVGEELSAGQEFYEIWYNEDTNEVTGASMNGNIITVKSSILR